MEDKKLTYAGAGVDIDRAARAKKRIAELARSTFNQSVRSDIGLFSGLYRFDPAGYRRPLLVASADGVGTKIKVAIMAGVHNTIGHDLVCHCVNDILAQGAFPLFFLDYIAMARIDPAVVEQLVDGLARGCREAGCALIGGETAEMPEVYREGEYDLAGFIVGAVEEDRVIDGSGIVPGDILIGLPSAGLHTNGYSLARKVFFEALKLDVSSYLPELGRTLGEELLAPHRSYLGALRDLISARAIKGIAHITGGGITDNLPRVLPEGRQALVRLSAWEPPPVFRLIARAGNVPEDEMYRTFNMGIGMVLIVSPDQTDRIEAELKARGEAFMAIGEITAGERKVVYVS